MRAARARIGWSLSLLLFVLRAHSATSPRLEDKWIRIDTAHFTLLSNASETKTRGVGADLETLQAMLTRIWPTLSGQSPRPTLIYVFRDDATLRPYRPLTPDGAPKDVAGYFSRGWEANYVALRPVSQSPYDVVFHEYLHFFLETHFGRVPLWFNEGFAELFSTFTVKDGRAEIGRPIFPHVHWLEGQRTTPLRDLLAIDTTSKEYNEQSRRGTFYAQSWLFVHYLFIEAPERRAALFRFLDLLAQGKPQDEAFAEAFRATYADIEKALSKYRVRGLLPVLRADVGELAIDRTTKVQPLTQAAALCHLGDLLAHLDKRLAAEAEAYFVAARELEPGLVAVQLGLGLLRESEGKHAEAVALYRRGVELAPQDELAHFLLARGLLGLASEMGAADPARGERLTEARQAARRSLALNPQRGEAYNALGVSYLLDAGQRELTEGVASLEKAWSLMPARTDIAVDLVELYSRQRAYERARQVAEGALVRDPTAEIAAAGRRALGRVSLAEIEALIAAGRIDEAKGRIRKLLAAEPDAVLKENLERRLADLAKPDPDRPAQPAPPPH